MPVFRSALNNFPSYNDSTLYRQCTLVKLAAFCKIKIGPLRPVIQLAWTKQFFFFLTFADVTFVVCFFKVGNLGHDHVLVIINILCIEIFGTPMV